MFRSEKEFRKLGTKARLDAVRENGNYVDSRSFGSYLVHLYQVDSFYAEVWLRRDTDQICWIEVVPVQTVADNYVRDVNIRLELGL
jgi:hypothetical protein